MSITFIQKVTISVKLKCKKLMTKLTKLKSYEQN